MHDLEFQDILLAALLLEGGATLTHIDPRDRLSTLYLSSVRLQKSMLVLGLRDLANVIEALEDVTDSTQWQWLFENSFLGKVDREARRLRSLIKRKR